jgi:Bacterial mobilisation protein (MobC)
VTDDAAAVAPTVRRYGKRPLPDARKDFVAVRCNASEYASLTAAAAQAGLSVGAYLRTLALGTAGPRAVRRPPVQRAELARLLGELGKLGSNVNQIARQVNATGNLPAWSELSTMREDIGVLRAAVMKALGRGD